MQWLVSLEGDPDIILVCRLANIFRRKGLGVQTLNLATQPDRLDLLALVESPEIEVDHIFNFLRRTAGVRHVTCYRRETAGKTPLMTPVKTTRTTPCPELVSAEAP